MVDNDLAAELATMQVSASALGRLDRPARTRVLHWLQERFDGEAAPATAITVPAVPVATALRVVPPASAADELLSVETLTDLFAPLGTPAAATQPVTAMLHEFVAEFQDLAREWDGACGAPLSAAS